MAARRMAIIGGGALGGTAVFSSKLGVTLFGLLFTPVFYVVVRWLARLGRRKPALAAVGPQRS